MTVAMTTGTPTTTGLRAGRDLVAPALFDRLAARVAAEEAVPLQQAERVMDQALAFLGACAVSTVPLVPSVQVDPGWHVFVLHTRDYAEFCDRVAGRFLHHEPTTGTSPAGTVTATVAAIRAAGYAVDTALWQRGEAANCGESGCGAGRPPAAA